MAEAQQLDPWRSSYLQLKSMSAMLSDIHRKIVQLSEGGPRSDGIRPGAHADAENLDLNLRSQDRREPVSVDVENLDLNSPSQNHQAPEVAAPSVNPRYRSPRLEFQRHSERSFSFTSGNRDFCEAGYVRFGDPQGVEVVEDFNKLLQIDDVETYTEKFEKLRASMLAFNPSLSEAYFVTSYISGLKQEIKNLVKLRRPKSLAAAYEQARLQFDAVQAIIRAPRMCLLPSIETLQEANGALDYAVDGDRKEEIVKEPIPYSDSEEESIDGSSSVEKIEDWDVDTDRDADVGCQGRMVLGVHPKKCNQEARDQSLVINTEFKGKTTSLNFELLVYEDCSRIAKCQKRFRNYETADAQQLLEEMPFRKFYSINSAIQLNSAPLCISNWVLEQYVFDPGITECQSYMYDGSSKQVVEQTVLKWKECGLKLVPSCECDSCKHGRIIFDLSHAAVIVTTSHELDAVIWVYDRGKGNFISTDVGLNQVAVEIKTVQRLLVQFHEPWRPPYAILQAVIMDGCWVLDGFLVFDPGGVHAWLATKLLNSIALVVVNSFPFDKGKMEVTYGIHLIDFIEPIWMEERMTIFENGELFMMLPIYITKLPCLSEDQETNWKGFDVTTRAEIVKQRLQWDPGGLHNVLCLNIVGKEQVISSD